MMRWSQSALFAMQTCGEKYRRRYIEREFLPSGVAAKRGIAFHEAAKVVHRRQREAVAAGGEVAEAIPSAEEARDLAATAFDKEVADNGVSFSPGEDQKKAMGEAKDFAVTASGIYVRDVAPGIVPVAVERKVVLSPRGWDMELVGVLDLVAQVARENGAVAEEVRDQKTRGRRPPKGQADMSQQLTFYHMLRQKESGQAPASLRLVSMVRLEPTKTLPQRDEVHQQATTRTDEDVAALLRRIRASADAVEKGVFVPTSPEMTPLCSPRYCEYATTCKYVSFKEGR